MNYAVTNYQALEEVPRLWRQEKPRKVPRKVQGKMLTIKP